MKKTILCIMLATSLLACKKDEKEVKPFVEPIDVLDPITDTGAGTLSCIYGGRVFASTNYVMDTTVQASAFAWYNTENGQLFIKGIRRSFSGESAMTLSLLNIRDTGLYQHQINDSIAKFDYATYELDSFNNLKYFQTTLREDNYVHITKLDTIAKIISGTFGFETIHFGVGNIRTASQGRFDVRY